MEILPSLVLALITAFGTATTTLADTVDLKYCESAGYWAELQMLKRIDQENWTFSDAAAELSDYQLQQKKFYHLTLKIINATQIIKEGDASFRKLLGDATRVTTTSFCITYFRLGR